jgi:tRNA-dihydrouridine synthase B
MSLNFISSPFYIGSLKFPNRLIQGPLAGISAAPFRRLFYQFLAPAYTVTEMISAQDLLTKHTVHSRYLYRAPEEKRLCYQLAGVDPLVMAQAALKLQHIGADLIDINCGCPKPKIRKKGAGSALMENPEHLSLIVRRVREQIRIPLTVKLRIHGTPMDVTLAKMLEQAGADALIIHGRRWTDSYDNPCDFQHIGFIKQHLCIPVIANGDIRDNDSLDQAIMESNADAYMISRAGCGRPWLYQHLLQQQPIPPPLAISFDSFMQHVHHLGQLESEYQAVIQSRTFVRYYFRHLFSAKQLNTFYTLTDLNQVTEYINQLYC